MCHAWGMDTSLFSAWPLAAVLAVFAAAALAILAAGIRMSREADRLADLTGWGEAIFGAILLGGSTSLSGIVTSVSTAYEGHAPLAISNAVGGIAVQTAFLAIADMFYRRANLEHAAASVENMMYSALLIALLSLPLAAIASPETAVWQVHPASLLLIGGYLYGMRLVAQARARPYWRPIRTAETRADVPEQATLDHISMPLTWLRFALLAAVVGVSGYLVGQAGIALAGRTGLSETVVGSLFTAIVTSLPELVTSVAAVRQGALTLAVGAVVGGNCFDVLFIALSDLGYRQGSIYHALTVQESYLLGLTILLNAVLLLGMLRREKAGIANIGFESFLVVVFYLTGIGLLFT